MSSLHSLTCYCPQQPFKLQIVSYPRHGPSYSRTKWFPKTVGKAVVDLGTAHPQECFWLLDHPCSPFNCKQPVDTQDGWASMAAQTQKLLHTVHYANSYLGQASILPQTLETKNISGTRTWTSWGIRKQLDISESNLKSTMILTLYFICKLKSRIIQAWKYLIIFCL